MAMKHGTAGLLLASMVSIAVAAGGGGGGGSGMGRDADTEATQHAQPDYVRAVAAIKAEQWPEAVSGMERHLRRNDRDADGHNWLGYAYRKQGKLDEAFSQYKRALALDPRHLGAHEYLGETYLLAGQPDEANKHLKRLAELCGTNCEQFRDLQQAISTYTAKK